MPLLAVLAAVAGAEPPSGTARLELSPPEFPYHRAATLTVTAEAPADVEITLPDFSKIPEGIETQVSPPETLPAPEGVKRLRQRCLLGAVAPGKYRLPDLKVEMERGGEKRTVTLPGPLLNARELTEKEREAAQGFADPEPAVSVFGTARKMSPWLVVPAILAVLAGAGLLAARRIRRSKRGGEPPKPPWETAFQRLRTLQAAGLSDAGRFEAFYVDLSAILRYYIEDRFALPAPEQTTQEFLETAPGHGELTPEQVAFLSEFLVFCDRVKFANHVPTRHGAKEHFDAVETFVTATIPHRGEEAA